MSLPKVLSIKVNQISFSNGDFVIVHPIHYLSLVVSNVDLISAAGFEPNKLSTEKRWKPSHSKPRSPRPDIDKPHKLLRSSSSVLTQGKCSNHSRYKMPPGTAKVKKNTNAI